ncbi:hypothetical protein Trydic_g17211 [Trypoxylus dichotomus]
MAPLDRFEYFCEDNQVLNTTNVENSNKNENGSCINIRREYIRADTWFEADYRPEDQGDKRTIIDKGNAVLRVKKWNGISERQEEADVLCTRRDGENVIRTAHEDTAHLGVEKITEYIRETYWFPNMKENVKAYIHNCFKCIVYNPKYGPREGLLHNIDKGNKPFNTLHIDHLGPLEKSKQYHRHILVTIDAFSKFIKLFLCKGTTSCETVIDLQNYFTMYSRPQRIISDKGTYFTSAEFKRFIDGNNIKHILITTGVPRANGQVEVINRIMTPMLAKLCVDKKIWNKMLHEVEFALNNTVNSSTKETPSKLLFGVPQTGRVSDELRQILLDSYGNERNLEEARNEAEENIKKQQEYSKAYYDGKHKDALTYQIGDHVVIKNFHNTPGVNKKLIPKFKGSYVVKKVLPNDWYAIGDPPDFQNTQIPFDGVVDSNNMKLWSKRI